MPANPAVARRLATLTLTTFVLAITTSAWGQTNTAPVMPPHSIVPPTPDGKSIGAWTADFWAWTFAVPEPLNAFFDETGVNANNGQPDGPVFFLQGAPNQEVERAFTVPAGKYLLVPLVTFACWGDAECPTLEACRACADITASVSVNALFCNVNGLVIGGLGLHRELSPGFFQFFIVEGNIFDNTPGPSGNSVSDGYWIMLEPLSEGERLELIYGLSESLDGFFYSITAHITAVPVDCNTNTIFDSCDIDCGEPGGPCDVPGCGASTDCDGSLIPDECDADCWPTNLPNGIPDYCDVLNCPAGNASCADCNANRVPDECDTFIGFSQDCQSDGIPDECQTQGAVSASWAAGSGNWNVGANWCPNLTPDFPDNHVGTNYDVTIEGASSVVTLNTSPSVNSLSLSPGATVVVNDAGGANVRTLHSDGDIANEGVFRATDRERLVLDAPLIDQGGQCGVGGALEATDGALGAGEQTDKSILEVNGARVLGGIARTIGQNSEIHLIGGAELVDVCVDGVVIPDGQTGAFSGTVTNDGIMSVRGRTLDTRLDPRSADAVLEGGGCVQLTSQSFSRLGDFKASFTNSKTHRIEGGGLVYGGMINNGTLRADLPGQHLILSPPGNKRNDGLFLATGGGTLRLADDVSGSGRFQALGGTILLNPADESVSVQGSSLDVEDDDVSHPGRVVLNADSSLEITDNILVRPGGSLELNGNATVAVGQLVLDGEGAICECGAGRSGTVAGGRTPPGIKIGGTAQVQVRQDLVLRGGTRVGNSSSAGILLGGSFDNQSECECLFDWTKGALTFYGEGVHKIEISGRDIGPTIQGFGSGEYTNFAMGTIAVQAGVTVEFVDNVDYDGEPIPTMCDEALYIHELILGARASISIQNCRVYAEVFQGDMAAVAGMGVGCGAFGFLPTGDIDRNRRVDLQDWARVRNCLQGPSVHVSECGLTDFDGDGDVDLNDLRWFQTRFTGP